MDYRVLYQHYLNLQSLATRLVDPSSMGFNKAMGGYVVLRGPKPRWSVLERWLSRPRWRPMIVLGPGWNDTRTMWLISETGGRVDVVVTGAVTVDPWVARTMASRASWARHRVIEGDRLWANRLLPIRPWERWFRNDWMVPYTILAILHTDGKRKRPIHRLPYYLVAELNRMLRHVK